MTNLEYQSRKLPDWRCHCCGRSISYRTTKCMHCARSKTIVVDEAVLIRKGTEQMEEVIVEQKKDQSFIEDLQVLCERYGVHMTNMTETTVDMGPVPDGHKRLVLITVGSNEWPATKEQMTAVANLFSGKTTVEESMTIIWNHTMQIRFLDVPGGAQLLIPKDLTNYRIGMDLALGEDSHVCTCKDSCGEKEKDANG